MGGGEVIPVHPVVAHQQPARETLLKGVAAVGQRRLAHLDHERLHEPDQVLVQGWTGRHRAPKVIGPDPQALARGLDKALVRRAIQPQEDRDA